MSGHHGFFFRPAYTGPGAGLELLSYFMGLLAWVGTALGAVLLWPLYSLVRRWRGVKQDKVSEPAAAAVPESSREESPTQP
jgi:hypothetical protein